MRCVLFPCYKIRFRIRWLLGVCIGLCLVYFTVVKKDNATMVYMKYQNNMSVSTQSSPFSAQNKLTTVTNATPQIGQHYEDNGTQCTEEKRHVMYLKIEKTGGGTFEGILVRFGLKRKLLFAIPTKGDRLCHFPQEPILPRMITKIAKQPHAKFDILYRHSVYNRTTIKDTFPNDTVNIVSVRNPFIRFLSSFDYFFDFRYKSTLPKEMQTSVDKHLQVTTFMNRFYSEFNRTDKKPKGNWYLNLASYRLGIPMGKIHNPAFVKIFLEEILPDFKLVLLNEYYDESLVLLKRLLCWKLEDIVYVSIHVRAGLTKRVDLWTKQLLRQHKVLAPAEYAMYDKLSQRFWDQVHAEGPDFWSEVQTFKNMNSLFNSFCKGNLSEPEESLRLERNRWHGEIEFVRKDCDVLSVNLDEFTCKTRESYLKN